MSSDAKRRKPPENVFIFLLLVAGFLIKCSQGLFVALVAAGPTATSGIADCFLWAAAFLLAIVYLIQR